MALEDLFRPLTVRSLTTPNRFAMAPMTRQASPGGVPGPDVAEYYRRRAAGGVGLIITEGIRLPDPAAGYPSSIPTLAGAEVLTMLRSFDVEKKLNTFHWRVRAPSGKAAAKP